MPARRLVFELSLVKDAPQLRGAGDGHGGVHRAAHALHFSFLMGSHPARAHGCGPQLDTTDATLSGMEDSNAVISGGQHPGKICTLTVHGPQIRDAPRLDKDPLYIRPMGVEVGFVGADPYVGHKSKVVLSAIENRKTAAAFTLRISGPNGHRFESQVEIPTDGPSQVEVPTPVWPVAGMYMVHIGPPIPNPSRRRWRGNARHFEVRDHPLAHQVGLPKGHVESGRSIENILIGTGESPSLIRCGQNKGHEICVRSTHPIADCSALLEATMEAVPRTAGTKRSRETARWCSEGRMLTVYSNRRRGQQESIDELQERFAPDSPQALTQDTRK